MDLTDGRITVRSYRTVFAFERRLYRFDRWRIPLRGGLPLRALLYAPLTYGVLAAMSPLPVIGWLLGVLPDQLRWGLLPLALVVALLRVTLDGRPAHRALWAIARWRLSSRWLAGLRRCPPPHGLVAVLGTWVVRPDWRDGRYRAGRVAGPARVLLRYRAELSAPSSRSGPLVVEPSPETAPLRVGRVVEIPAGRELELR